MRDLGKMTDRRLDRLTYREAVVLYVNTYGATPSSLLSKENLIRSLKAAREEMADVVR